MKGYTCRTQADLDKAIKAMEVDDWLDITGDGEFYIYDSAQVTAYGSAQVTASGSAQVTAYGSAQVTAYGSAQVRASGSAQVRASKHVAVTVDHRYGDPKVDGGIVIDLPPIETAANWLDWYGLEPDDGMVTLFKAVDDDHSTDRARRAGIAYTPGATDIEAPDWDPEPECGGGFHLCPTPHHALAFREAAPRFVGCPVLVEDITVHPNASMPSKVKVPRIVGPIVEVDIDGTPIVRGTRS